MSTDDTPRVYLELDRRYLPIEREPDWCLDLPDGLPGPDRLYDPRCRKYLEVDRLMHIPGPDDGLWLLATLRWMEGRWTRHEYWRITPMAAAQIVVRRGVELAGPLYHLRKYVQPVRLAPHGTGGGMPGESGAHGGRQDDPAPPDGPTRRKRKAGRRQGDLTADERRIMAARRSNPDATFEELKSLARTDMLIADIKRVVRKVERREARASEREPGRLTNPPSSRD